MTDVDDMKYELGWPSYMGIMVVYSDHCEYRTDVLTSVELGILERMGFQIIGAYPTVTILDEQRIVVLLESPYETNPVIEGAE